MGTTPSSARGIAAVCLTCAITSFDFPALGARWWLHLGMVCDGGRRVGWPHWGVEGDGVERVTSIVIDLHTHCGRSGCGRQRARARGTRLLLKPRQKGATSMQFWCVRA
jgi:hypothetical protein